MARSGLILPSGQRRQPRQPLSRLAQRVPASPKRIRLGGDGPPRKHRRPRHERGLTQKLPVSPRGWLIALIVFSLLVHALIVLAFVFVGRHMPKFTEPPPPPDKSPEVSLVLAPPPPPQRKPEFIPTKPQVNTPPQNAPLISDNDNVLKSKSQKSRAPDAPVPDVTGKPDHSFDLESRPPSLKFDSNPTPPAPQAPQQQQEQKNAQQKPNDATKPVPPDPSAIHPTDNPQKSQATAKEKPLDQQLDANGLPVLPQLNAPTIAPQTPQTQPIPSPRRPTPPNSKPSFAVYQSDISGMAGQPGDNSPAAMATDLGRYKAKIYRAVGARWYEKVSSQLQVLGVGTVHISYTIYSDGHLVITADPDSSTQSLMLLHSISRNSMTEAAPFDAFSEAMKKDVGDSYSDDFSFSIYGN